MFTFAPTVRVPDETVKEICQELQKLLFRRLADNTTKDELENESVRVEDVRLCLSRATQDLLRGNRVVTVNNYIRSKMKADVVEEIQKQLDAGHFIGAIKAFRNATGMGLKDSKDFIESFGQGSEVQAANFRAAFAE